MQEAIPGCRLRLYAFPGVTWPLRHTTVTNLAKASARRNNGYQVPDHRTFDNGGGYADYGHALAVGGDGSIVVVGEIQHAGPSPPRKIHRNPELFFAVMIR